MAPVPMLLLHWALESSSGVCLSGNTGGTGRVIIRLLRHFPSVPPVSFLRVQVKPPSRAKAGAEGRHKAVRHSRGFSTVSSFMTENTPETPFACSPAMFLSPSVATTPTSFTSPFFTMM